MPIKVSCNNCGGVLHAPDDAAGKRGRCPTCGTILTITPDEARGSAYPTPFPPPAGDAVRPAAFPPAATRSNPFGGPPAEPAAAFPRPPVLGGGDGLKSSYGLGTKAATDSDAGGRASSHIPPAPQTMAFGGGRVPGGDGRKFGDPFSKPSSTPATAETTARQWAKVRGGLRWAQLGVLFKTLAVVALAGLVIAEQNGVPLPDKKPGFLGATNLAANDEIKAGVVGTLWLLAGLCLVRGRFGIAAAPASSLARGLARLAAAGTLLGMVGALASVGFALSTTLKDAPPKLVPDVLAERLPLQFRLENYSHQIFQPADEFFGQAQRFAFAAVLAGVLTGELWFLAALSRLAVHLRSDRAAARLTRYLVLIGLLFGLAVFVWLAVDLSGDTSRATFWTKWDGLMPNLKAMVPVLLLLGVTLAGAVLYWRILGGVRQAVMEATDPSPFGR